jgi:SAM-dependent methyltransferase
MISVEAMKPFGLALMDYVAGEKEAILTLGREDDEKGFLPVAEFFREADAEPLEKLALDNCQGRVLDIGAGAGIHSLYLQNRGFSVCALDILPEACKVMWDRGIREVFCGTPYEYEGESFGTLLLMGRSIGNVETLAGLDDFLTDVRRLVKPGGRIILNSADVRITDNPQHLAYHEFARRIGRYIGELRIYLEYKGVKGPMFGLLHVDPGTLAEHAATTGWSCDILFEGKEGNYLACLTKENAE